MSTPNATTLIDLIRQQSLSLIASDAALDPWDEEAAGVAWLQHALEYCLDDFLLDHDADHLAIQSWSVFPNVLAVSAYLDTLPEDVLYDLIVHFQSLFDSE